MKRNWKENVINCRTCKHSFAKFIGNYILHHIQSHVASNQRYFVGGCYGGNTANATTNVNKNSGWRFDNDQAIYP